MSSIKELNKLIAKLHLELGALLSDELEKSRLEFDDVLNASNLTAAELEQIEEGDTTDFAKIAALCAALELRLTLNPDFTVALTQISVPRVTFEPHAVARWADDLHSSTTPKYRRRLETYVSEPGFSETSTKTAGQLVHAS
ncbi:hypothetical protein BH23CHL5_BH23CHL5_28230 [soil metagenome]